MTKLSMKNILLVYTSQAEYNTYRDILKARKDDEINLYLLDISDFCVYCINKNIDITETIIRDKFKHWKLPHLIIQLLRIIYLKVKFHKFCSIHGITNVTLGTDQEPPYLVIINYCKTHNIVTTVFQHGLYLPNSVEYYERQLYQKRFSKLGLFLYLQSRKILSILTIFPERKPYGLNDASQYYFYSKYYKKLFIKDGKFPEYKIKIVGPTKYAYLPPNKSVKQKKIIYANYLITKRFPYLNISDYEIIETILNNIPKDYNFIIKPHPSEKREDYTKLMKGIGNRQCKIYDPQVKIEGLIEKAEILLTTFSSVIYDAIYYDTLVILIDFGDKYQIEDNDITKITFADIKKGKIKEIIDDKISMKEKLIKQQKFFNRHLGVNIKQNPYKFIQYLK